MKTKINKFFKAVILVVAFFMVTNADGQNAYITNYGGTISVIDVATNLIINTINSVGIEPYGVSVSHDGSKVYVANLDGTLSIINTATNTISATIQVGPYNIEGVCVSPNDSLVYVTSFNGNKVSVINAATDSVSAIISVGVSPYGIVVSPDGSKVYVVNNGNIDHNVYVINTATNLVSDIIIVGYEPYGIAVSPDGTKLYVTDQGDNSLSVINTTSNTVIATIPVGLLPLGVCVSPDGNTVYVANGNDTTISVINTATNTVSATITVGHNPYGVSISLDGTKVLVANQYSNTVSVINTNTNIVSATITGLDVPVAFGNFIIPAPCSPLSPLITPSGPTTFCQGNSVTLDAGTWSFYLWSDGTTTETDSITISGTFTVIVTDANGCTGTASQDIMVNPTPIIYVDFTYPYPCDTGFTTITTSSPYANYLWSTGETTQSITVTVEDNYYITATDFNGCVGTNSMYVWVDHMMPDYIPEFSLYSTIPFCSNDGFYFDIYTMSQNSYWYIFDSNGSFGYQYNYDAGLFQGFFNSTVDTIYTYSVYGGTCVTDTSYTVLYANISPQPIVTADGPTTFCPGGSVDLDAGAGYASYLWGNNGETSEAITAFSGNVYQVTVTDFNGCTGAGGIQINVPIPYPEIDGPTSFCHGDSLINAVISVNNNRLSYVAAYGGIINMPYCDATGIVRSNPCDTTSVGFIFRDMGSFAHATNVEVTLYIAVECDSGSYHSTMLNGYPGPNFNETPTWCSFDYPNPVHTVTFDFTPTNYHLGDFDTVMIGHISNCFGLLGNSNGSGGYGGYASVTVTYDTAYYTSFLWSPGGETTSSITVSTDSTVTYTVAITSAASSCVGVYDYTITANPVSTWPIRVSSASTFCQSGYITLEHSS